MMANLGDLLSKDGSASGCGEEAGSFFAREGEAENEDLQAMTRAQKGLQGEVLKRHFGDVPALVPLSDAAGQGPSGSGSDSDDVVLMAEEGDASVVGDSVMADRGDREGGDPGALSDADLDTPLARLARML